MSTTGKKKIRILHVVGAMDAAGLETLIMNIYRNIDREKFQFDFAVQTNEESFYDKEIVELGGRIISHPKPKGNLKRYKKSLEKTLTEFGPYDAVHSHLLFFTGVVLSVAKKQNIPVRIAHSHNTSDSRSSSLLRFLYRQIMRRKILLNATHYLGCSKEACEYVFGKNAWNAGLATHFPNAIDSSKFKELKRDRNYLIKELNIPEDTKIIGHVGRFTKQKNHTFILNIFSEYIKTNPDTHLILVGDGNDRGTINKLIKERNIENKVHCLGVRKDVENIFSSLDVFLFPSLYEGLGIVLVEAQAARVPCVISDVIPIEADLNIGLVQRLNLSSEVSKWMECIENSMNLDECDWAVVEKALNDLGYDITANVNNLSRIYRGM